MQVRFWGTRGSIAKPGTGTVRYGGNTACVEVRADDGTLIVLDCGTGAHGLGRALTANGKDAQRGHLLITHTHWDHIQGFPFFAPLRLPSSDWDVYGPRAVGTSLRDILAGQMSYTYFPVDLTGLDANVHYHELVEGVFELGGVRVQARYLNHPAVTLGYRLEADGVVVVYATDHEPHSRQLALGEPATELVREDDAHAEFLEGADLVIHDTQFTAAEYPGHVGWGHSTVEYVVDQTRDKGIRRVALFHHDPLRDDDGIDRLVNVATDRLGRDTGRMQVLGAAEGMVLKLEPAPGPARVRDCAPSARRTPERAAQDTAIVLAASDPTNLAVFRRAAAADGLDLQIAPDASALDALSAEASPTLVILERELLGDRMESVVERLREASSKQPGSLQIVGLTRETTTSTPSASSVAGVDEWVATPVTDVYARSRLRSWLLRTACRWQPALVPPDEPQRLQALHDLRILDTPPEERFDRYTRIAAALFRAPIALVSLVDADRQWFKSKYGHSGQGSPRDQAFCAHAILGSDTMQVSDARRHPDFADNPLVTGPPYVRFYAGVPLTLAGGARVGTLCIIDRYPRTLDPKEVALLEDLGRLVEQTLEQGPTSAGD